MAETDLEQRLSRAEAENSSLREEKGALQQENAALRGVLGAQVTGVRWLSWFTTRVVLGAELRDSFRSWFTTALTHRKIDPIETADAAAAVVGRIVRVGLIAILLVLLPQGVLIWQATLLREQNRGLSLQTKLLEEQNLSVSKQALLLQEQYRTDALDRAYVDGPPHAIQPADHLRVRCCALTPGFHWDVNPRNATIVYSPLEAWRVREGGHLNVYPDGAMRGARQYATLIPQNKKPR